MQFKTSHPTADPLLTQVDITLDPLYEATGQVLKVNWGDTVAGSTDGPSSTDVALASGVLTAQHTYAKAGFYRVRVSSNEVSRHSDIQVGTQVIPGWDPRAVRDNTYAGRQEREAEVTAGALQAKRRVGRPRSALKRIRQRWGG